MSKVHPKPLSAERLASAYGKLGFSERKREFIHKFYKAAANLYGVVLVDEVAAIYREYGNRIKENLYWRRQYVKNITRNDFRKYSEVAMRDDNLTYCFYDGDELYEESAPGARFLIQKDLVGKGAYRFNGVYGIREGVHDEYPFFIPDDFLDYAEPKPIAGLEEFRNFLAGLVSSADEVRSCVVFAGKFSAMLPNENKGKRLDAIYTITEQDYILQKELGCGKFEWLSPAYQKAIRDEQGKPRNCADKFARCVVCDINENVLETSEILQTLVYRLEDVGVAVEGDVFQNLAKYFTYLNNNMRKYCILGWTSEELFKQMGPPESIVLELGPLFKELLKNGDFDPEDLRQRIMDSKKLSTEARESLLDKLDEVLEKNKKS